MYVARLVLCELSFLSCECVPLGMYQALIVWDLCEFVPDAPGPVRSHAGPSQEPQTCGSVPRWGQASLLPPP